jgi:hypothetical protein
MHACNWTFGIRLGSPLIIAAVTMPLLVAIAMAAELPSEPVPPAGQAGREKVAPAAGLDASPMLSGFLEQIVRSQLQEEYVDDDDWGKTRRVTVGHKINGKPFRWELQPRKKVVNDGLWEKYAVRLVDPNDHLDVRVHRLELQGGKLVFAISLSAKLNGDARLERWRQGIKILNAHIEAVAHVDVELAGDVTIRLTTGNGSLPAVAIEPVLTDLDIKLKKFKLKRISKLDGMLAHELGDGLKDTIQRELNRREPKIIDKLNKSIDKRRERLVLSAEQFAKTGWAKLQTGLEGK